MPSLPLYRNASLRQIEAHFAGEPLMQRAGEVAARWASEIATDRDGAILIVAGPGNNGGDAFVAATLLRQWGQTVHLVFAGDASRLPDAAAAAHANFLASGGVILPDIPQRQPWRLIIDGIFGIGLTRAPDGQYADWITRLNRLAGCPLLALDCPSGLNADTGQALGATIRASHTLSFIAGKPGLLTADGPDHCGEIRIAPLDLPAPAEADGRTIAIEQFAAQLRPRRHNSHKGNHGSVGILGGAHSMLGSVFLAGRAALKLGAGRVYLGLLAPDAPPIDLGQPELMLRKPESLFGAELTAVACGPGMGTSLQAAELLEHALSLPIPLVLDADAINLLAFESSLQTALRTRSAPTLLTPHPAEAGRLLDSEVQVIQNDRIGAACEMASRFHCHVALKGCGTVVAAPDGRWWINTTGNPGLATAGTGDVLTGIAVALLAQGWETEAAALAAVHLHGVAADALVAVGEGPIGLAASELIAPARRLLNRWIAEASASGEW